MLKSGREVLYPTRIHKPDDKVIDIETKEDMVIPTEEYITTSGGEIVFVVPLRYLRITLFARVRL